MFSGALMLGTSLPALAINNQADGVEITADAPATIESQTLAIAALRGDAVPIERDGWGVTSYAELLQLKYGARNYSYTVGNSGPIRWPFPYAVPISSGFGDRQAPCRGCSSDHRGIDFTPGAGTPIYAIADGVVSGYTEGWSYGNHIFIDHVINGQKITSLYAHMQTGTVAVFPGDQILVGDYIGLVGSTGASTGAHLHLEIRLDGTIPTDPFVWLRMNAG